MDTPYSADFLVLEELIDTGNLLDGAKLHLATAGTAPGPHMELADFTEADFTGYASVVITWAGPIDGASGEPELLSQLCVFKSTDADTDQTITHWFITDGAGAVLLAAQQFDSPIPVVGLNGGFAIAVSFRRYDGGYVVA